MKLKRLIAGVLSAAMMLSIGSTLAFAAVGNVAYDDDTGMTFDSVMNLSKDAVSAPNVTYTYTLTGLDNVTAYTDNDATSYNFVNSSTFVPSTTEQTAVFSILDYATSTNTVTKTVTFDFKTVNYTEPGVYVYQIEEAADVTMDTLYNESNQTRYVYVTVKNDDATGATVSVTNILMTTAGIDSIIVSDDGKVTTTTEKSDGYTHSYGVEPTVTPDEDEDPEDEDEDEDDTVEPGEPGGTSTLQGYAISFVTMGDMANANKDFTFTPTVATGVADGTIFKVGTNSYVIYSDGSTGNVKVDEDVVAEGLYFITLSTTTTGATYIIITDDDTDSGYSEFTFTLSDDKEYIIYGVTDGMSFTTTISDAASDGYSFYSRAYEDVVGTEWNESDNHTGTADATFNTTEGSAFVAVRGADDTLNRDGTDEDDKIDDDDGIKYTSAFPETGVVLDLLPYVVMVALAGAFIAFRVVKSARKDEE